jgi:hypothetical protein
MRVAYAHNSDFLSDLQSNKYPLFCRALQQKFVVKITAKMLRAMAVLAVQTTTVVISGAAPNGNYTAQFVGTTATGATFDVTIPAFVAAGNTNAQIAAGIEALIQTARATTLAGIVTNETVSTATISIVFAAGVTCTVSLTVPGTAVATIARTYAVTLNPTSRLLGWPVMSEFFEHVIRGNCILHRPVAVAGLAAVTMVVGDAGVADALLTATSLAATGSVQTTAATEYNPRYEAAFVPQIQITATTNPFSAVTAGLIFVEIENSPVPEVAG